MISLPLFMLFNACRSQPVWITRRSMSYVLGLVEGYCPAPLVWGQPDLLGLGFCHGTGDGVGFRITVTSRFLPENGTIYRKYRSLMDVESRSRLKRAAIITSPCRTRSHPHLHFLSTLACYYYTPTYSTLVALFSLLFLKRGRHLRVLLCGILLAGNFFFTERATCLLFHLLQTFAQMLSSQWDHPGPSYLKLSPPSSLYLSTLLYFSTALISSDIVNIYIYFCFSPKNVIMMRAKFLVCFVHSLLCFCCLEQCLVSSCHSINTFGTDRVNIPQKEQRGRALEVREMADV